MRLKTKLKKKAIGFIHSRKPSKPNAVAANAMGDPENSDEACAEYDVVVGLVNGGDQLLM